MLNQKEYNRKYYVDNEDKFMEYREKNKVKIEKYNKKYYEKNKGYFSAKRKKRYKKNKEDESEKNKKWKGKNKEYLKKYNKKYRNENKEYCLELMKQWRDNNKEKIKEYKNIYNKTDNGKATGQRANIKRRAREREIINTLTSEEWLDILKEYKYKCVYCGKEFNLFDRPEKDHIIPISKGGHNTKENIVPACKSCNSKKGNKINWKGERKCVLR